MKGEYNMAKKRTPQKPQPFNRRNNNRPAILKVDSDSAEATSEVDDQLDQSGDVEEQMDNISEQEPNVVDPLMSEVETFLTRRSELSRRLDEEIQATEQRLAELRQTAAKLFPENHKDGKDKKARKPRAKNVPKTPDAVAPAVVVTAEPTPAAEAA